MSFLLLCSWSSMLLFVWMVHRKYKWTAPPYRKLIFFALAGLNATIPADLTNKFLSRETELWVFSADRLKSFGGFLIGAGMGEEFFKFSAGLLLLLCFSAVRVETTATTRFLGFVTVGLTFATFENLLAYGNIPMFAMVTRGVLAVPLHASMSMIHGASVNRAYRQGSPLPLLWGYLLSVLLHTLYDTVGVLQQWIPPKLALAPLVAAMLAWGLWYWRRLPENDYVPAPGDAAGLGNIERPFPGVSRRQRRRPIGG